ncbi:MAG: FAD-dependent oxidoreductase, partial [Dehalococcoidales bacterium]
MYDAVVIGGGPIGSYTAGKLAEAGHDVAVLEREPQAGTGVCCTGIVSQECVSAFDIDDSVILKKVNSARLFSPSGNLLHVQREETQACILDRAAFDLMMANRAIKKGAKYLPDRLVSRLENK